MRNKIITDIVGWDVKNWSRAVEFWESRVRWERVQDCLELGAGAGGLSLWLALKGKNVTCSDLFNAPEFRREALHASYDLHGTITYADVDATALSFREEYDLVVLKSVLGGVRPASKETSQSVVDGIFRALRPGGIFLFAENLVGSKAHQFIRKVCAPQGYRWRHLTFREMEELLSAFSSKEIVTAGITGVYGRNHFLQNILGNLDEHVLEHVCPETWRYIAFGMAVK